MNEAIKEMEKSDGDTKVGAVIVKDGEIISRGYRSSDSHAERNAIESALKNGIKLKGSILFTTLEPCIKKSPNPEKKSCCELIKKTGISTVFIGSYDPNPTINRNGWKYLRDHKIDRKDFDSDLREIIKNKNSLFEKNFTEKKAKFDDVEGAKFDYQQNNGVFRIYYPESETKYIDTRWSLCGINAIYAYASGSGKVALAKYAKSFEEIDDCTAYDFSFHSQRIEINEIAIFLNPEDRMAMLVKIEEVASGPRFGSDTIYAKVTFKARSY